MIIDWVKLALEQNKAIISIVLLLLGISGVSIYGNVKEINPWRNAEVVIEEAIEEIIIKEVPVKVVERIIETRVESGITKQEVQTMIDIAIATQDEEWH
jgi:predicted RNA methylase